MGILKRHRIREIEKRGSLALSRQSSSIVGGQKFTEGTFMGIRYEKSESLRESFLAVANLYEEYALRMTQASAVAVKLAQAMEEHAQRIKELNLDSRQQTPD